MQAGKIVSNRFFWVLCIMGAFAILSSTMSKNPVLNPFAISLGTPADLTGIIAAASTIPGILVSLPAASLSDVFGRRKMLLFATFVFASAPFLYLFVAKFGGSYHLCVSTMALRLQFLFPSLKPQLLNIIPPRRGERISSFNSATAVGRGLAPFLGGSILFVTGYGFHTLYLAVGVAGAVSFIIALFLLSENKTEICGAG